MGRPPGTTVFVGNISYETTEEQLKEVFSQVGTVASFRLMYDHETGKAKGFGFCEYEDKETAMSARRNLNGTELNGRPLRVDLTENDKQAAAAAAGGAGGAAGKDANPLGLPPPLASANPTMARMTPRDIHDTMLLLKRAIIQDTNAVRDMLLHKPSLAHAVLHGQIMLGMIPPLPPPPAGQPPPPGPPGQHVPPGQPPIARPPPLNRPPPPQRNAPPQPLAPQRPQPPMPQGAPRGAPPPLQPQALPVRAPPPQALQGRAPPPQGLQGRAPPPPQGLQGRPPPPQALQGRPPPPQALQGRPPPPQALQGRPPPPQALQGRPPPPQGLQGRAPPPQVQPPGGLSQPPPPGMQAPPMLNEEQRNLFATVMALTPEQIAALPPGEREGVMIVRNQFARSAEMGAQGALQPPPPPPGQYR